MARTEQEEANARMVVEFYNRVLVPLDFTHAMEYLSPNYRQHDPLATDGPEGLRTFLVQARKESPNAETYIKRVFAEGDHVILHVNVILEPGTKGLAVMDIFRIENGKIAEHWDVIQPIPEHSLNDNSMF